MSLTDFIHPVPSQTDGTDDYDHAIVLIDATKPAKIDTGLETDDGTASLSRAGTATQLGKRWTRGTLREELVRRKYAKWQEEKTEDTDEPVGTTNDGKGPAVEGASSDPVETSRGSLTRTDRFRDKNPFKKKKTVSRKTETEQTSIDILYENQRGWFLCGIPLYSSRSLLPIDPPSWQTATFQYSPVNITNAQPPDPSWVWAWRTWYVDMSYDVDEEGWQYSFNFGQWAWHGTHPWFHSYVRRRRWLRKRVKLYPLKAVGDAGNLKQAHMLNEDYFTIHTTRDRSRQSSQDRNTENQSSFLGNARSESDAEQDTGDISDILKLMGALKRARVDREKVWAVRAFVDQGGDELFYLADSVEKIMDNFIYRSSRWQLQSFLLEEYSAAKEQKQKDDEDHRDEDEALIKKLNCLLKAVHAAKAYMENDSRKDLEHDKAGDSTANTEDSSGSEAAAKHGSTVGEKPEDDENSIRGESVTTEEEDDNSIPATEEPSLLLSTTQDQDQGKDQDSRLPSSGKGKERA